MESHIGKKSVGYGPVTTDMMAMGKRSLEWDLNDWGWDNHLLRATPLNSPPSDPRSRQLFPPGPELALSGYVSNSTSSCSEDANLSDENPTRESEKKRRVVLPEDEELNVEALPLNLKLGGQLYPIVEAEADKCEVKSGKKSKGGGTIPICQVEGCVSDLSHAKDYHRRHKVCEIHSKATEALVGNVVQRFCQQCSRFHALQEFDQGKRSCRRRLAGHNKRRRKAPPETPANAGSLTDETSAGQLLCSLLRILSNMHANVSDPSKDQHLLSQLLRDLAGSSNGSNASGLLQGCAQNMVESNGIPAKDSSRFQEPSQSPPSTDALGGRLVRENHCDNLRTGSLSQPNVLHGTGGTIPANGSVQDTSAQRLNIGGIDLNNVYSDDSLDCISDQEKGNGCVSAMYWAEPNLPSPPQTSGTSASTSDRSSSSSGEAQCRTDRIVFKLFDKSPNDLPNGLRTQILDWLSLSPTDIEGYIKPGCIVLTLYLRLNESLWEQFRHDMSSSLSRLLVMSNDPFWKRGWIYTRIQQQAAFICDGQVVLDTLLPYKSQRSRISSVSPIAVPPTEMVQLRVKGSNLSGSTSGLLCAVEGRYLVQESCYNLVEDADVATEQDEFESLSFCFRVPDVVGRGFIEVEDYGLTGCFFPFIVAEPEVSSEICTLEREMEAVDIDEDIEGQCGERGSKNRALDFVHEMGWLLHRNNVRLKPDQTVSESDLFPFVRLKWLVEFSLDHEWRAVLRKLMDLLFSGAVDTRGYTSVEDALSDMAILHTAVQRNSRPLVEFLLRYVPEKSENASVFDQKLPEFGARNSMVFRPDVVVAGGLTPLHIAASRVGSDNVLEALLEDPGMVGIEAWRNARDSTGLTPSDYASLRGHYSYIDLAKRKINPKPSDKHVVLDVASLSYLESGQKQTEKLKFTEFDTFYTEKPQLLQSCKLCEQKPDYRFGGPPAMFRPAMLGLVAIAVVCVCTALLFKSGPRVCGTFGPFRWEALKYGAM